jgi:hypothetical protein
VLQIHARLAHLYYGAAMDSPDLPVGLSDFTTPAARELRHVYDLNSDRHDPLIGDDAIVFGVSIYRNSWYVLERLVEDLDGWTSSRPEGSLVISGTGYRIHVYRHGQNEEVDLDSFRLDDGVSETKRSIAVSNGAQLTLEFEPLPSDEARSADQSELRELVIIHAGNPDDGCCGVWIGAPVPADEIRLSPWHWIEPLWLIERSSLQEGSAEQAERLRHDELPEPDVSVEAIDEAAIEDGTE